MACRPASSVTAKKGKPCQTMARMTAHIAVVGCASQAIGCASRPSRTPISLRMPRLKSSIQVQTRPMMTLGSAQGTTIRARAMPRQAKLRLSSSAVIRPSANCSPTPAMTQISELPRLAQKVGSVSERDVVGKTDKGPHARAKQDHLVEGHPDGLGRGEEHEHACRDERGREESPGRGELGQPPATERHRRVRVDARRWFQPK